MPGTKWDGRNWSFDLSGRTPGGGAVTSRSATKVTGSLIGGPELASKLVKLTAATGEKPALEAVKAGADVLVEEWKGRVEVGPGVLHYRDAISAKIRQGKNGAGGTVGVRQLSEPPSDGESDPTEYVASIEFGEAHQPARPWARTAFESAAPRVVDTIGAHLTRAVEGVR